MSSSLRITGLATGMDVDEMVKSLMKAENTRLDKIKQDRQTVQWKQDIYRELIGDINTVKSTYFDVVKPDSYMLSANSYAGFDITTSDGGSSSSSTVSATAGAGASAGTYSIEVVKLAKAAAITSGSHNSTTTANTTLSSLGVSGASSLTITYSNKGTSKTVAVDISDSSKTIRDVINSISSATSGDVTAKFSELTGKFTLHTSSTGASTSLSIDNGSAELLNALKLSTGAGTGAQDAEVNITPPGGSEVNVKKSSNSFTIDGINYNLLKESSGTDSTITVSSNVQKTYDKIKAFVDKYNEIIGKLQTKISEKKDYNYKALTDEQKKEMKDEEIKSWESKVKQGILKGDSSLQNMIYALRKAFFDSVEGAGISLKEVGLSTDSDYSQGGKIIIDEAKLKDAIKNHGDQVANLFMKNSDISYDPDHKTDSGRYKEVGIFQRINDIFKDYTRTTRDSNGNKGILIAKAGVVGDISEIDNLLSRQLEDNYDKRIEELEDKLAEKESRYYEQFAKLESAIQKLNSQSSWLSQQFGSSS